MPKSFSLLVVLGFVIFPASALIVVFNVLDFSFFLNKNMPIMPKLHSFTNAESTEITMANAKLWGVFFVPYMMLFIWIIFYLILIFFSQYNLYLGSNILTNFSIYFCFFLVLIFISSIFVFNDLELTKFGRKSPDYSTAMSLKNYVDWQAKIYLFFMGLFTAINFLILTRVIMFRKAS